MPYKDKEKQKKYWKQYYRTHLKEKKEYDRQYYQNHSEERNKRTVLWHKNNPEKVRKINQTYYEKNLKREKERHKQYYEDNREDIRKRMKQKQQKRKQYVDNYKRNRGCSVCGYKKCAEALIFHHFNNDKEFNIGRGRMRNLEELEGEMAKCIILCKNCHAELHEKLRKEMV